MTNNLSSQPQLDLSFVERAKSRIKRLNQAAQELASELQLPPESRYAILTAMEEDVSAPPPEDDDLIINDPVPTVYLSREAPPLAVDTIIQNRYKIDRVIGIGGMGAVYRVCDLRFRDVVKWHALKEMLIKFADHFDQQTHMRTFEREANLLALLNHPLIPKVHDFFFEENRAYLVLDYVQGKNLEEVLKEAGEAKQFLDEQQVVDWALQMCEVLEYLHSFGPLPIIFRDLKPANIMLTPQNQIRLIDFGIAKLFQPQRRATMIGTEGYSPPEQYKGFVDARSDIYSLGATLHHLLTASDPRLETPFTFHERLPRQFNPSLSAEMEAVIMKCLAYQSEQRWQSVSNVQAALQYIRQQNAHSASNQIFSSSRAPLQRPPRPLQEEEHRYHMRSLDPSPSFQPKRRDLFPERSGPHTLPKDDQPAKLPSVLDPSGSQNASHGCGQVSSPVPHPTLLWKFKTDEEVRSSPAMAQNTLYIGSYDKNIYALETETGECKWTFATEGGICVTPACVGDLVIVGSEDHHIYALNALTHTAIWTYRAGNAVRSSPRIVQGRVIVGSDDGLVHAIELRSGRQGWTFQTWREVRSSAVHAWGILYIGSYDEHLYAIDAYTGQEKWNFVAQESIHSNPVFGDELIYFGSMDGTLYAIDPASGWPVWKYRTSGYILASPTLSEGRIFIGSVDKHVYCLEAKTGRHLWKYQADGQITSTAAAAGGFIYFGSSDGAIYCLDARNGQVHWIYQTDGSVPSSPLVRDGVLYVGSNDHYVYALRCEG